MHARAEQPIHTPEVDNSEFIFLRQELSRLLNQIKDSQLLDKFEERRVNTILTGLKAKDYPTNPEKALETVFAVLNQPVRNTPEFSRLRSQIYLSFEKHGFLQRFTHEKALPPEVHLFEILDEYYQKTKAKKKKISENEKKYIAQLEYAILDIKNSQGELSLDRIQNLLKKTLPAYSYADMEKARKNGTTIGIGTDEYRDLKTKIGLFLEQGSDTTQSQATPDPDDEPPMTQAAEPPANLPIDDVDFAYGAAGAGELPKVRAVTLLRPARGGRRSLNTSPTPTPKEGTAVVSPLQPIEDHHTPGDVFDLHFEGDIGLPPEPTNALPSLTRSPTDVYPPPGESTWSEADDALLEDSFAFGEESLGSSPTNPYTFETPKNTMARRMELALLNYSPTPTEAKDYNKIQAAIQSYGDDPSEGNHKNVITVLDDTQNNISEHLVGNRRGVEYHTKAFIDLTAELYKILDAESEDLDAQPTQEYTAPELALAGSLRQYLDGRTLIDSEWLEQYEVEIIQDTLDVISRGDSFDEIHEFLSEIVRWQQQNTINFDEPFLEVFRPVCTFYKVEIPSYLTRPSILQTTRGLPKVQIEPSPSNQFRQEKSTVAQFTPPLTRMESPAPELHDDPMATSVEAVASAPELPDPTEVESEELEEPDFLPAKVNPKAPEAAVENEKEKEEPQDAEERESKIKEFKKNFPKMKPEEQVMSRNIIFHLRNKNLTDEEFTQMVTNIPFDQLLSPYFTDFLRTIDHSFFQSANENLIHALDVHTLHSVGTEGNTTVFANYGEMRRRGMERKKNEDATTLKAKQSNLRKQIRTAVGTEYAAYIPEDFYLQFKNPEDFTREKILDVLSEQRIELSNQLHAQKITAGEIGRAFEGAEPTFLGKLFRSKERKWAVKRNEILSNKEALRWRALDQLLKKVPTILP